jgi:hypothetical protein
MIDARDLTNRAAGWLRPRGRPRLCVGPTERICVRVPEHLYDALDQRARRTETSVPDVIRQVLMAHLDD